jgi:uncharacterized delta-60 repeat protein
VGQAGDAQAVTVQPDGKVVGAGFTSANSQYAFMVSRFNADGTADTSFNSTGTAVSSVSDIGATVSSVLIQDDGKILAAGGTAGTSSYSTAVARYTTDGQLDGTFGNAGILVTPIGTWSQAFGMSFSPFGYMTVAASSDGGSLAFLQIWQ